MHLSLSACIVYWVNIIQHFADTFYYLYQLGIPNLLQSTFPETSDTASLSWITILLSFKNIVIAVLVVQEREQNHKSCLSCCTTDF